MLWWISLAAQVAAAAPVQVERLDDNSWLLAVAANSSSRSLDLQAGTKPAARRACGTRRPVLGRFRFLGENAESRFEQELLCIDPSHELSLSRTAEDDAELKPSRADQQAVLAATYSYFAAKDAARYTAAYRFMSGRVRNGSSLAAWTRSAREFNAEAGAVRGRRVVEITWYRNPQDAPEPGVYVAADFSAEFERVEFVCGYLMWRVEPDGTFKLSREEQNMAPKRRSGRPIAQIDRDPLRSRMGCKD